MKNGTKRGRTTLAVAIVIAAAGAIILTVALLIPGPSPATFGWFAYAPLADATFAPSVAIAFPMWALSGFGLLVAGLVTTSFILGQRSGANRRGSDSPQR